MIQFREIKRIFKETTGKDCRVFYKDKCIQAEFYDKRFACYRLCLFKDKRYFELPEMPQKYLRQVFKQYINN